jgi:pseudouridine synthase
MRVQKYLSQKRILSRREAEDFIKRGLIKVNGKIVSQMGTQIDPDKDEVEVLQEKTEKMTVAINKPRGIVSSKNIMEGRTVFELFPQFKNLNAVGRLDKESEGLLLLSNDGVVTSIVTGDSHLIEKEYQVEVREKLSQSKIKRMADGIRIDGKMTLPAKTKILSSYSFSIILKEGRKHQIRRMCDALNLTVVSLKRLRIGNIFLRGIHPGAYKILSEKEVAGLKSIPLRT